MKGGLKPPFARRHGAHTALQKAGVKTLHLTVRNSDVTAIAYFQVKKQYEEVH